MIECPKATMFELWNNYTERDEYLFELTSAEANTEHQNSENTLGIKCAETSKPAH